MRIGLSCVVVLNIFGILNVLIVRDSDGITSHLYLSGSLVLRLDVKDVGNNLDVMGFLER